MRAAVLFICSMLGAAGILEAQPRPARSDLEIEVEIKARLAKSKIGKNGFTVRVKNGVAYWEGRTEVPQHKGAATRMAKSAGARQVVNNIKVASKEPRRVEVKPPG